MTADEIKEGLLKKLFEFYIPEIQRIENLINESSEPLWFNGMTEHSNTAINLRIDFNDDHSYNNIHCTLHITRYSNEEPYEENFNSVKNAIISMKRRFKLNYILCLVENTKRILDHRNATCIDKIKYFLEIGKNTDLINLSKRSVLFEKYKP
jgi:hypothetical protein